MNFSKSIFSSVVMATAALLPSTSSAYQAAPSVVLDNGSVPRIAYARSVTDRSRLFYKDFLEASKDMEKIDILTRKTGGEVRNTIHFNFK